MWTRVSLPLVVPGTVLIGAGLLLADPPSPSPADKTARVRALPTLVVNASYPGASANTAEDMLAAPIELLMGRLDGSRFLRSRCSSDGKYTLVVALDPGTDLTAALKLAQNRVNAALALLPGASRPTGVPVLIKPPGIQAIVVLTSPDRSHDITALSSYARGQLKTEFERLAGVSAVAVVGYRESCLRVWIDADRLTARGLTAAEVRQVLKDQPPQPAAARPDKPANAKELEVGTPAARLRVAEQLENVVLKTDGAGNLVRLRDVAKVEVGIDAEGSETFLNGEPAVTLCVDPVRQGNPKELETAILDLVTKLRGKLPPGLDLRVPFEFILDPKDPERPATGEFLLIDLAVPAAESGDRAREILRRCAGLVRQTAGIQDVLTLSEDPFDPFGRGPCLLCSRLPVRKRELGREQFGQELRSRLGAVKGLGVRLREPSSLGQTLQWAYPVDLAVHGPDRGKVVQFARNLGQRLRQCKELTDVAVATASEPQRHVHLEVDGDKCAASGVGVAALFDTLQAILGGSSGADIKYSGHKLRVAAPTAGPATDVAEVLKKFQVGNGTGEKIPLSTLVAVRYTTEPAVVDLLDRQPMEEITANLAAGVSPSEARKLCESVAAEGRKELRLPADYRLTWLQDMPAIP